MDGSALNRDRKTGEDVVASVNLDSVKAIAASRVSFDSYHGIDSPMFSLALRGAWEKLAARRRPKTDESSRAIAPCWHK